MAVEVRLGEKEIIAACLENMDSVIYTAEAPGVSGKCEDDTQPSHPSNEMFKKEDTRAKRRKT